MSRKNGLNVISAEFRIWSPEIPEALKTKPPLLTAIAVLFCYLNHNFIFQLTYYLYSQRPFGQAVITGAFPSHPSVLGIMFIAHIYLIEGSALPLLVISWILTHSRSRTLGDERNSEKGGKYRVHQPRFEPQRKHPQDDKIPVNKWWRSGSKPPKIIAFSTQFSELKIGEDRDRNLSIFSSPHGKPLSITHGNRCLSPQTD